MDLNHWTIVSNGKESGILITESFLPAKKSLQDLSVLVKQIHNFIGCVNKYSDQYKGHF